MQALARLLRRPAPSAVAAAPFAAPRTGIKERYVAWTFRFLGQRLDAKPRPELAETLEQAGIHVSPGTFLGLQAVTAVAAAAAFLLVGAVVSLVLVPGGLGGVFAVLPAILAGGATYFAFPTVLNSRIQNRRHAIDAELPYTLSELSVLAGIGLSPIQLVRRLAARDHDPAATAEFGKIVARADLEGKDLITALTEVAKKTASPTLRETLWDLANLVHQGGDLEAYLRNQSDHILEAKRSGQEQFVEQLTTYADMYVTVVLIGVMFVGVGAFLLDAFRSTMGGLSANGLLLALTYGLVPLVVIVLGLLLSAAHGKAQ